MRSLPYLFEFNHECRIASCPPSGRRRPKEARYDKGKRRLVLRSWLPKRASGRQDGRRSPAKGRRRERRRRRLAGSLRPKPGCPARRLARQPADPAVPRRRPPSRMGGSTRRPRPNALIACDGRPVGYLSWRKVTREALDAVGVHGFRRGWSNETFDRRGGLRRRGLGPKALALLAKGCAPTRWFPSPA